MNDPDLVQVRRIGPAIHLGPAKAADRHAELGQGQLAPKVKGLGAVELLGPMHREAEGRPPQQPRKTRDPRRVRAEMGVDVLQAQGLGPRRDAGAFGQIDQLPRQAGFARLRSGMGPGNGTAQLPGIGARRAGQVAQQARAARLKDAFGAVVFLAVGRVLQGLGIAPHGKPMDVETQGFQRRNLTPDEAVRGPGIGVDEIADSQGCKPLSNTRGTQKRRFKLVSA